MYLIHIELCSQQNLHQHRSHFNNPTMYAYNGLLELFVLKILLPFSAYLLLCTVFQVFAKIA